MTTTNAALPLAEPEPALNARSKRACLGRKTVEAMRPLNWINPGATT